MPRPTAKSVATISITYGLIGMLWILFSDLLLEGLVTDPRRITMIQTYKGWVFVVASSILIGWLVRADIRAREKERSTLHEARTALQWIVRSFPEAIVALDSQGMVRIWNPAAERLFGWKAAEVLGRANPIVGPEVKAEYDQLRSRAIQESFAGVEVSRLRKDGSYIDVSLSSAPMLDDERGQVTMALAVFTDIRPRKQAEAERIRLLAHAEAARADAETAQREAQEAARVVELRAAQLAGLAVASLAINSAQTVSAVLQCVTDQARSIIGVHRCMTSLRSESDWSTPVHAVSVSERFREWRESSLQLHGEGSGWLAAPLVGKDGSNLGVIQVSDKYDGEFDQHDEAVLVQLSQFAVVAVENVRLYGAAQEAEYRLRRQLLFTRAVTSSMGEGVCAVDTQGIITFANPVAAQALGWIEAELQGQSVSAIFLGPEDAVQPTGESLALSVLTTGKSVVRDDECLIRQDGSILPVDYAAAPILVDGQITGAVLTFHDITQRKHAAAELEEFHQTIRTIFDSITDGFFALDNEWCVTFLNEAAARLLRTKVADLAGKNLWQAFPEAIGSTFEREYRRVITEQISVQFEEYFPPLSAWFEVHAYPARVGLSVYFRDVTDRKQAEEALKKNQKLLFEAERISHTGAWEWDIQSGLWTVSDEWMKIHGVEKNTFNTEQLYKLADQKDLPRIVNAIEDVLTNGKSYDLRHRVIRESNGETRVVQAYGEVIHDSDGNPIRLIGVAQDITEREQAEERVRQAEKRYQSLIENAPDGVVLINVEGVMIYASPSAKRIFGYEEQEFERFNPSDHTHPEDLPMVQAGLVEIIQNPQKIITLEYRFEHKLGNWLWVESTFTICWLNPAWVPLLLTSERLLTENKWKARCCKNRQT